MSGAPSPAGSGESPALIRERAVALVEYLLAVRAQLEKPARTVPTVDVFWPDTLPSHPACSVGPSTDGTSWLRVGNPAAPRPLPVPAEFADRIGGPVTATDEPKLRTDEPAAAGPAVPRPADPGPAAHGPAWSETTDLEPTRLGLTGSSPTRPGLTGSSPPRPDPTGSSPTRPGPTGSAGTGSAAAEVATGGGPDDTDAFEQWRERHWRPWAADAVATGRVRRLHRDLFDLRHRLDMTAATHELVYGHGILELTVGQHPVRYPLVVTPVAIEYEPDRSLVSVSPQGPGRLQTDPLAGLDERYLGQFAALGGAGGQVDVDLWSELDRRELFERALRRLGADPTVVAPGEPADGAARVVDTGVLFVRPRQRMLRGFLEQLRERLLAGGPVGALAAILAHEPSRLRMPDDQPQRWESTGRRLLMPLPTNDAQESIARRLSQHRNVAVQGPPGTGKTHTIRNLICHLMADGKRVLVVAQKEDPLRVLRDGLPEQVRSLCLAVLGNSADQLTQLQMAARELSDRGATLDRTAEAARVHRLTGQLAEAERELAQALDGLRRMAESEAATYRIDGLPLSAGEVGSWLRAHADAYGDLADPVDPDTPVPLGADGFAALLELAGRLDPADRACAVRDLPVPAELPAAAALRTDRYRLAAAAAEQSRLAGAGLDPAAVRAEGRAGLAELRDGLRDAVNWLSRRAGTWTDRLGRLLVEAHWQRSWDDHAAAASAVLDELVAAARVVAGHQVTIAGNLDGEPRRLLEQLAELRDRFATGKGVNRLLQPGLARLAGDCRVDGEALRGAADVDVVAAYVRRGQLRRRLRTAWDEWADRLDIPETARTGEPEVWAATLGGAAARDLDWDRRPWPALSARLRRLAPQAELGPDPGRLTALAALLERAPAVFDHDDLLAADRALAARLERGLSAPRAGELWQSLHDAWRDPELAGWDAHLAEARRLAALRPDVERYADLHARLAAAAPRWAAAVDRAEPAALAGTGADCLRRWTWAQAQTWFDTVVGGSDATVLGRRVEQCRDRIRRLTHDLVVASAWLAVAGSLDDRRKAALADWTTALRKIGKGTGKYAAAWQGHAQRAMNLAVDAVPVWVMSVDRAVEQFAGGAHFDVVIVDEASQADLFALPVLTLADRAVVVGDDQQIGPQLGFVGPVAGLIDTHLGDVPSAEHFDPESSLYDHAVRRSPERILLTEHFRCLPQIIEFSSRHYYDGRIDPLRTDRVAGLGDPVVAVHVPDGSRQQLPGYGDVNVPEAQALLDRLAAIVADPAYAGRSIGVISLLSTSGQAVYLLSRIRERIGPAEMAARRLRVGDPYTFQGDERDVVLVSLVAAAADGRLAAFTRREFHRRVNVAASRPRDQLWVFHSLLPDDLRPDDARAMLLAYCRHPPAVEHADGDLERYCESDLEREVLRRLLARGYRPVPQYRIGAYRIDFVLPAPGGRRLAVECDGDAYQGPEQWAADIRRQAILERVGNCVFVRIRASLANRDPDAALQPLWHRLAELGIEPHRPTT